MMWRISRFTTPDIRIHLNGSLPLRSTLQFLCFALSSSLGLLLGCKLQSCFFGDDLIKSVGMTEHVRLWLIFGFGGLGLPCGFLEEGSLFGRWGRRRTSVTVSFCRMYS